MVADIAEIEVHRPALAGHCYRMLGSVVDADDATQETMIRAWKSLDRFDGRAALRDCDECVPGRACRSKASGASDSGRSPVLRCTPLDALIQRPREHWIEPIADARAIPADTDPSQRAILRQSIRLAFVAALQKLSPK